MLNLTPFFYSLATILPCSSVASAGYYAYRYFFDGTSSTSSIDHSVEINKDISTNRNDYTSLTSHKSLREGQKSRTETEQSLLIEKLAAQKKERAESTNKINTLVADISKATNQITEIQDDLAKKLEEKSTHIAQEKLLSEELHKLKVAEIKEAEAYSEVEKIKKAYDNKVELLKAQDKVAIAHEAAKTEEVTKLNKEINESYKQQQKLGDDFVKVVKEKLAAEQAFDNASKKLNKHKEKVEEEAIKKDTEKGHEITELVILKKEIEEKKRNLNATLIEKLEKQNVQKVECQTVLKTLHGKNYNGNCEWEESEVPRDAYIFNLARQKYLPVRNAVREVEKELVELEKQYKKLHDRWLKAKTEKIETEDALKKAKDETLKLRKLQQAASAEKDAKVAEFIKIKGELDAVNKEQAIKEKEFALLQAALTKASSTANGIVAELKDLNSQKQQVTDTYEAAKAAYTLAQQKKKEQQDKINDSKAAIKKLEEEIDQSSLELNKQHQTKETKTKELADEKDNLETLDILIPSTSKQIKDKNNQINKLSNEIGTLDTKLQSLNSEIIQESHLLSNTSPDTTFDI